MNSPLTRRSALGRIAGGAVTAAVAASLGQRLIAADAAAGSAMKGRINHSVCKWCFGKIPLEEFAKAVKEFGIESVELLDPKDWPTVQKLGLTCALATGTTTIPVGFNRIENHAKYVASMTERINAVADAGLPSVIVFSGNRTDKAGFTVSDEQGIENCAIGLKQIMGVAEKRGVNVIMELLNSKVNHKDYMCDRTPWGVELVKRVGSERFKLLYDIYHMQIMEGDVIRTIQENHKYIGHYHTAGNPGRAEFEPGDQQELYYPPIMRAIAATGFKGFVAQEFIPKRDPLTSLRAAVKLCTV